LPYWLHVNEYIRRALTFTHFVCFSIQLLEMSYCADDMAREQDPYILEGKNRHPQALDSTSIVAVAVIRFLGERKKRNMQVQD